MAATTVRDFDGESDDQPKNILTRLREVALELGGVELDIPPRTGTMRVVEFDEHLLGD
jgi:hypothetical protein